MMELTRSLELIRKFKKFVDCLLFNFRSKKRNADSMGYGTWLDTVYLQIQVVVFCCCLFFQLQCTLLQQVDQSINHCPKPLIS